MYDDKYSKYAALIHAINKDNFYIPISFPGATAPMGHGGSSDIHARDAPQPPGWKITGWFFKLLEHSSS